MVRLWCNGGKVGRVGVRIRWYGGKGRGGGKGKVVRVVEVLKVRW